MKILKFKQFNESFNDIDSDFNEYEPIINGAIAKFIERDPDEWSARDYIKKQDVQYGSKGIGCNLPNCLMSFVKKQNNTYYSVYDLEECENCGAYDKLIKMDDDGELWMTTVDNYVVVVS